VNNIYPHQPDEYRHSLQTDSIFFFFDMSIQEGGGGIRTSDLRFMRHGPSRLSYLLGTKRIAFLEKKKGLH
jgi:hypothetical protein